MKKVFAFATIAALGATFTLSGAVQAQDDMDPVQWKVTTVSKSVAPGGVATVKVSAEIEDGWHIYSITQPAGGPQATRITVVKDQPYTIKGKITPAKAPAVKFDENFNMNVEYHTVNSEFTVPLEVASSVKTGSTSVSEPPNALAISTMETVPKVVWKPVRPRRETHGSFSRSLQFFGGGSFFGL